MLNTYSWQVMQRNAHVDARSACMVASSLTGTCLEVLCVGVKARKRDAKSIRCTATDNVFSNAHYHRIVWCLVDVDSVNRG